MFLGLFLVLFTTPSFANEEIELQLKWKHAFQFAGYYVAKDKGYYEEEGLNVRIIEGGPRQSPLKHVLEGDGHYGITDTGALVARANGSPINVLAAIFQHSPLALAVKKSSGIESFKDLRSKRVMIQSDGMDAVILAAIYKAGLTGSDIVQQPSSFDLNDLILGATDAFSIYTTDQPRQLEALGVEYHILNPIESDIDFYGDVIIASEQEVQNHPDRVDSFLRASIKGWHYALEHPDEAIALIQDEYNSQRLPYKQLKFEADKTADIIIKDEIELGYISEHRWSYIGKIYHELNLISEPFDLNGFVYKPKPSLIGYISQHRWQIFISLLLLILLFYCIQSIFLKRVVRERTKELHKSETQFRDLFEKNKSVGIVVDPSDGSIIDANKAAVEFYGYNKRQLLALNISSINTLSIEKVRDEMLAAKSEQRNYFVFKHRLANGEIRDVEIHSGPIEWDGKELLYSIVHDISERKRAEHYIQKTSEILDAVAKGEKPKLIYSRICNLYETRNPDMRASILWLQGNQLFHAASPILPEAYSQAIDGVKIGASVGSCGTAAFLRKRVIVENIATDPLWSKFKGLALSHGLQACWSEPIIGSSGNLLGTFAMYFDHPSKPTNDELLDIVGASGLASLVMERVQKDSELNKLSQATEQSGESILITDKNGTIEYVNPAFTKITGYTAEEALGNNPRMLKSGNQDKEYYEQLWKTLTSGKVWHSSVIDKRKDGSEYPALMTVSPIKSADGEITHYVGIQMDMSEHKTLEDKFRQAQKMEALGTLVGGIAHDFNNMLAAMTGNLYLAKRKVANCPEALEKLEKVERLSFGAAETVKQLLTFARKDAIEMKPFNLTSFMKEVSKLHESIIPQSVRFIEQYPSDEFIVNGEPNQIQQMLINLLNNARDAVEGVKDAQITIALDGFTSNENFINRTSDAYASKFAHVTIKDNGYGISKEDREHIFDPFFTTKEVGVGTGLGLAMAYGTIKSHGGLIDVESELNEGTSFHIYLPLLNENASEFEIEKLDNVIQGSGQLILLVDDDIEVRITGKDVLESMGYKVIEASDGLEAVERFKANQRDIALVIMDVVMPRLGGVEAAEQIFKIDSKAKLIFSSGYDKNELYLKGMSDSKVMISKPYSIGELSEVITNQLDN